jgi:hypothetical protein
MKIYKSNWNLSAGKKYFSSETLRENKFLIKKKDKVQPLV